jgi:hypothetical protein
MKKTVLTIAIVLGLGLTLFADPDGGGVFQRGTSQKEFYGSGWRDGDSPLLPALPQHGQSENADAPLGTGIALLTAFGAAYLVNKKRREE